jgi:lysophospholipase L1-like esterase
MTSDNAQRSPLKKTVFYLILVVISVVLSIAIGELAIRASKLFGPSTFIFRTFDPVLGVTLIPDVEGAHRRCYDGYVKINRYGMRDQERSIEKADGNYRIAVFSDSIIEAVHVKPEETAASLLEKRLNSESCGGKCEVLNFSVGGYSPLQYYLRYLRDGRRFDNDLVIVVLTDNDLPVVSAYKQDGTKGGNYAVGSLYPSPYLFPSGNSFQIAYPRKPPFTDFSLALFRHSDLAYLLYKFYNLYLKSPYQRPIQDAAPAWAKFQPSFLFLDPENEVSKAGWRQMEYVLDNFIKTVRDDGAKFLLVHWGYDVGSSPWYKPIPPGAELPAGFDPHYASKWFAKYGARKQIEVLNLNVILSQYIRDKEMKEPYLSFTCDFHFNPEGQSVIANSLFHHLMTHRTIPAPGSR